MKQTSCKTVLLIKCRKFTCFPPIFTKCLYFFNLSYHTEATSLAEYENAVNDLSFMADRIYDGKTLTCNATKDGRSPEAVGLLLDVTCKRNIDLHSICNAVLRNKAFPKSKN